MLKAPPLKSFVRQLHFVTDKCRSQEIRGGAFSIHHPDSYQKEIKKSTTYKWNKKCWWNINFLVYKIIFNCFKIFFLFSFPSVKLLHPQFPLLARTNVLSTIFFPLLARTNGLSTKALGKTSNNSFFVCLIWFKRDLLSNFFYPSLYYFSWWFV